MTVCHINGVPTKRAELLCIVLRAGDFFGPGAGNNWFSQALVKPGRPLTRVSVPGAPGSSVIVLRHADTVALEVGRYSADCQLVTAEGRIHTVWPQPEGSGRYRERNFKNFVLMPEVTIP